MRKRVSLASVDLFSFEPVDSRVRPLRLHPECPRECREWLHRIDFPSLGRTTGQSLPEYNQD